VTLHRLLERQVRRTNVNLAAELTPLVELVSATYEEFDQERRRQERTNSLLTEEVEQLNAKILSESEARVRAILDAVSDGVVIVDGDQRIDAFNAAADILFGRCPANRSAALPRDLGRRRSPDAIGRS
jgi:PAS domain-containing protein